MEEDPQLTHQECELLRPKYFGPLFKVDFYRLILDEAHAIKNISSQSLFPDIPQPCVGSEVSILISAQGTKACIELQAKYRWALTGTPVHNRLTGV
jgi:SNF2 family DNA or RNA helicase